MQLGSIFVLAVALAMDATAVAAARGLAAPAVPPRHVVRVALIFGGLQALMPLLGWLVGARLGTLVEAWDHWLIFGVLGVMGVKLLHDARSAPAERERLDDKAFAFGPLLLLGFATSIDALAAGLTLSMMEAPLLLSLVIIGAVTAVLSGLGVALGRRLGARVGQRLDVVGGVLLIGLGTKTLVEHLSQP